MWPRAAKENSAVQYKGRRPATRGIVNGILHSGYTLYWLRDAVRQGVGGLPTVTAAGRCICAWQYVYLDVLQDMTLPASVYFGAAASCTTSIMGMASAYQVLCFASFPGI